MERCQSPLGEVLGRDVRTNGCPMRAIEGTNYCLNHSPVIQVHRQTGIRVVPDQVIVEDRLSMPLVQRNTRSVTL
jgi:hypothetical protein